MFGFFISLICYLYKQSPYGNHTLILERKSIQDRMEMQTNVSGNNKTFHRSNIVVRVHYKSFWITTSGICYC